MTYYGGDVKRLTDAEITALIEELEDVVYRDGFDDGWSEDADSWESQARHRLHELQEEECRRDPFVRTLPSGGPSVMDVMAANLEKCRPMLDELFTGGLNYKFTASGFRSVDEPDTFPKITSYVAIGKRD